MIKMPRALLSDIFPTPWLPVLKEHNSARRMVSAQGYFRAEAWFSGRV